MYKPIQTALCEALVDAKALQDLLANSWSPYFGHLFFKIVGSDTIPVLFMTKEGGRLCVSDVKTQMETSYFRIEEVNQALRRVRLSLLQGFNIEGQTINDLKDIVRLEKSSAEVWIDLRDIAAFQLLSPNLVGRVLYTESKW